jgi:RNA polymerase sigma factor (sigma-70 family)
MTDSDPFSEMIKKLEEGDEEAADQLWRECYEKVVNFARKKLGGVSRKVADEEDIALSVLQSFCEAVQLGRFPSLKDRDDLWKILFKMTTWKSIDHRRKEKRNNIKSEGIFMSPDNERAGIHNMPGRLSEEAFAHLISEELEFYLGLLDDELGQYALAKLEGHKNQEIADDLGVSLKTVERRLNLIRQVWTETHRAEPDSPE